MTPLARELRSTLSLALPVVVAEVGWVAMQIVDIGMVGQLGPEAIGAVGVGSALFMALGVFGMGLLLGLDPLVSHAFGAGRLDECDRWLHHGVWLAVLVSLPLTMVAGVAVLTLDWWGFHPRVSGLARGYLAVVSWSMLPLLVFTALRRTLQAMGIVRAIMATLIIANLINALANWMLVFGHWGAPALGVQGAAWATCISRASMVLMLALIALRKRRSSVRAPGLFEQVRLWRLLAVGWPAAVHLSLEFGVFAAVTALAGRLEPYALAAHQIVVNLASLTFMVPLGISAAGGVRVGQAVGRRDAAGARRAGWLSLLLGTVFMSGAATAFITMPGPILGLFSANRQVIETGIVLLWVAALFQLFDGFQVVATGILRGLGDTRTAMVSNLAGHWLIGLPVGYALCFVWGWGVLGLWVGLSAGLILVGSILVPIWHRRVEALPSALAATGGV